MAGARFESPTIRLAAEFLGLIATVCALLIGFLAWQKTPVPDALAGLAGGAVGALATLLTTFTPSPVVGGRRVTDAESQRRQAFEDAMPSSSAATIIPTPPATMTDPLP